MLRQIIEIDEEKCDGCGLCIPSCKEGAIQLIDGKARLISDLFCDGLGACLGHCPQGAIEIIEREAEPYDEKQVIDKIATQPVTVLKAHLEHLLEHDDMEHYDEAIAYMKEKGIKNPLEQKGLNVIANAAPNMHPKAHGHGKGHAHGGCPGSQVIDRSAFADENSTGDNQRNESMLQQWPVQLHLVPPSAPYFKKKELVVLSTCSPIASANVHADYMKNRSVVVACPKLDYTDPYTDKLAAIMANSEMPKVIILVMEVPCCKGLTGIAMNAAKRSGRKNLVVEEHIMTLEGEIKEKNVLYNN